MTTRGGRGGTSVQKPRGRGKARGKKQCELGKAPSVSIKTNLSLRGFPQLTKPDASLLFSLLTLRSTGALCPYRHEMQHVGEFAHDKEVSDHTHRSFNQFCAAPNDGGLG